MKKIKYAIFLVILLIFPSFVLANNEYEITKYETHIDVKSSEEYSYRDVISATFFEDVVQIEKEISIPYNKSIIVDSLNISDTYNLEDLDNKKIITINHSNNKNYKYSLNYRVKSTKSISEKAYRISLANNYNTSILNTKFTISFPKETVSNNIRIYLNNNDITDSSSLTYYVNENKVVGTYKEKLNEDDKLYVYVDYSKINKENLLLTISFVLPISFLFISYMLWIIFGKDQKIVPKKTSVLPKKLNPLEVSLVYYGKVNKLDFIHMIPYLASKGYIKITEKKKNEYIISRTSTNSSRNLKDNMFIKTLFKKENSVSLSDYIDIISDSNKKETKISYVNELNTEELKRKMNKVYLKMSPILNGTEEKGKYYEVKSDSKRKYLLFMTSILLLIVTSLPFLEVKKLVFLPISAIFSIVTLKSILSIMDKIEDNNVSKKEMIASSLFIVVLTLIFLIPSLSINIKYIISYAICMICILLIFILYKYMPKRTIYGVKVMTSIEGFKKFILTSTDEELKRVFDLNDNYFYEALAYCNVLGITEELLKKTNKIKIQKPDWFESFDSFTITKFNNSLVRLGKISIPKEEK